MLWSAKRHDRATWPEKIGCKGVRVKDLESLLSRVNNSTYLTSTFVYVTWHILHSICIHLPCQCKNNTSQHCGIDFTRVTPLYFEPGLCFSVEQFTTSLSQRSVREDLQIPQHLTNIYKCHTDINSDLYQCHWATLLQSKQVCYQPSLDRCLLDMTPTGNIHTHSIFTCPYPHTKFDENGCTSLYLLEVGVSRLSPCEVRSWKEAQWSSWLSPVCRTWTPRKKSHPVLSLASHLKEVTQTKTVLHKKHTL